MKTALRVYKNCIDINYEIYGENEGFYKNVENIIEWKNRRFITDEEYSELRKLNRTRCDELFPV